SNSFRCHENACNEAAFGVDLTNVPAQRAALREAPDNRVIRLVERVHSAPGRRLDADTRHRMETRLHHDFSQVRLHTDAEAAASAHALGARAYTLGHNIVFGAGQFTPHTPAGAELLAHELAHVTQQPAKRDVQSIELDDPDHAVERDAVRAVDSGQVNERS